ncbi:MAG: tetratricopeptide repeat protein [Chitinivibrionales bacterium]|nr:tetratricopeptide repeat protein [Chitinivibrionales bacterium]
MVYKLGRMFCGCMLVLFLTGWAALAASEKNGVRKAQPVQLSSVRLFISTPATAKSAEFGETFNSFVEQYLFFRLRANANCEVIAPARIRQQLKKKSSFSNGSDFYNQLAVRMDATHILMLNYDMGRDGKTVHYYADIAACNGRDKTPIVAFELDSDLLNLQTVLDSCAKWVFSQTKIPYNSGLLSRFYTLRVTDGEMRTMKTVGKLSLVDDSTSKIERQKNAQQLAQMAERNPKNLLSLSCAATLYESTGDHILATTQCKQLLDVVPEYAALYADIARNLRLSGKYDDAVAYAAVAEKRGITTPALLLEGALTLEALRKYDKAQKAFELISANNPNDRSSLLFFARQANRQSQPQMAMQFCDKVLRIDPSDGFASLEKGKALQASKLYDKAESAFLEALRQMPQNVEVHMCLAELYNLTKNYDKAARYYEKALGHGQDWNTFSKTIQALESTNREKDLLAMLHKAELAFPDSVSIQKKLGTVYLSVGDTAKAIVHLEKFILTNEQDVEALMILGNLYRQQRSFEKAFYMYNHALPFMKDKTAGLLQLGILYLQKGDHDAAITNFLTIMKKQPDYPMIHRYCGDAWYEKSDWENALAEYKKARLFNKKDPFVQQRIASIYFQRAEYEAAAQEYEVLFDFQQNNESKSYYNCAIAYLFLGKVAKAESFMINGRKLGLPNAEIFYMIGMGYRTSSNNRKSIESMKSCLQLEPRHKNALQQLSELYLTEQLLAEAADVHIKLYELDTAKQWMLLGKAGLLYEQTKAMDKARSIFTLFVKKGYVDMDVFLHLARLEYGRKEYGAAAALLERIPKSKITDLSDIQMCATSYFSLQYYEKAIPWLMQWVATETAQVAPLDMLATSYEKKRNFPDAIRTYRKLAELTTGEKASNYLYQVAFLLENSSSTNEAIIQYKKNIKQTPADKRNYTQLIGLYEKSGQLNEARLLLEQAIVEIPSEALFIKQLAGNCLKQNDKSSAVKYFKQYLEKNPTDPEVLFQMGSLYYERGLYDKAVFYYKQAAAAAPKDFKINYQTGIVYHNLNYLSEAIYYFERAHAIDSVNIDVLNYLVLEYRSNNEATKLSQTLSLLTKLQPNNYATRVELGLALLSQGNTKEAIKNLEQACIMNPRDADTHILLAGLYATAGNRNGQFSHLQKALSASPYNSEILCQMGQFYLEQESEKAAGTYIEKALKQNPNNADALYLSGTISYRHGEYEKARTSVNKAIAGNRYNPRYLLLSSQIQYSTNNMDEALKRVEAARELDSTSIDILVYAGFLNKENGNASVATNMLQAALKKDANRGDCYLYLGDIALQERNFSSALQYYRQALSKDDDDERILMKLAQTLIDGGRIDEAKNHLVKILRKNEKHYEALYYLCHINIIEKDTQAVRVLLNNHKQDVQTVWHHLIRAEIAEMNQQNDAALISFEVALRLQPELTEALAGKGRIKLAQGSYDDAVVFFSKAAAHNPQDPYLQLNLGKAYEGLKQYNSAFTLYKTVAQSNANIIEAFCLLAELKSRSKEYSSAIEWLKQGIAQNPRSADLYYLLGSQYRQAGEYTNAIDAFNKALDKGARLYLEAYIDIANIYLHNLNNDREARKTLRKYLRKGGNRETIRENNLSILEL